MTISHCFLLSNLRNKIQVTLRIELQVDMSCVYTCTNRVNKWTVIYQNQGMYISVIFIKLTGSVAAVMSLTTVDTSGTLAGHGLLGASSA